MRLKPISSGITASISPSRSKGCHGGVSLHCPATCPRMERWRYASAHSRTNNAEIQRTMMRLTAKLRKPFFRRLFRFKAVRTWR
nr:MAG TPA: hypothetical protein [Caudoviricetes sp.]